MTSTAPTRSDLARPVAHRMLRDDLIRLTIAAEGIATGWTTCSDRRAVALAQWLDRLAAEIREQPVPAVDRRITLLDAVTARGGELVAADGSHRRVAAGQLGTALSALRDHVVLAPVATATTEWPTEGRRGSGWTFRLPRLLDVTSAAEQAQLRAAVSPGLWALLTLVVVPLHRRRERLVFAC